MVDFQDLKEKLSSLSWIKYLIITIVIIVVIIIVIFVIKYFKNKKSSQAEQFNLSKNNYKESFDIFIKRCIIFMGIILINDVILYFAGGKLVNLFNFLIS